LHKKIGGFGKNFNDAIFFSMFMKVLVVGCGNIGSVAAEELAKSMNSVRLLLRTETGQEPKRLLNESVKTTFHGFN